MFYSETLLSKTGPLARVWLSANLERKLSKSHILQSDIEKSVGAIVDQGQVPMALRLSGQLLLGVVRIYSRKTRYLLEDCNEALMKIKMAFRPGNVDLPAGASAHSAAALVLPDAITELDLVLPDASLLLADLGDIPQSTAHTSKKADITLAEDNLLQDSIEQERAAPEGEGFQFGDDVLQWEDLDLDIGDEPTGKSHQLREDSIEVGRDAQRGLDESGLAALDASMMDLDGEKTPRARTPEMGAQDDLGLDFEFDQTDNTAALAADTSALPEEDETMMNAPPLEDEEIVLEKTPAAEEGDKEATPRPSEAGEEREEEAPVDANADNTYVQDETTIRPSEEIEDEETIVVEKHKQIRKRKAATVIIDDAIEIRSKQIKAQQADHSNILKEPDFLPRDPTLLTLMSLHSTGKFAASIFFPKNMHPDLVELLSPDFVKSMAAAKRKRDEEPKAISGGEAEEPAAKKIQLTIPSDDEEHHDVTRGSAERELEANQTAGNETLELPDLRPNSPAHIEDLHLQDETMQAPSAYDQTMASSRPATPIPITSQPISLQTKHTVYLLRDEFDPKKGKSAKKSVQFKDLCPPATTHRSDATKMFFEILVLATKDAVKPKQKEGGFGEIEVSPKGGLWDKRAEERDEVQVAEEEEIRRQQEREGRQQQQQQQASSSTAPVTRTVVVSA